MRRRPTIHELRWPKDSAFDAVAAWPRDFSIQVLTRVWDAFDRLVKDVLSGIDWSDVEHLERGLADLHFDQIMALQTGEEPFLPTREVPVFESRQSSRAMPPSNDFGFKIRGGDWSLVWPLEAKVITKRRGAGAYLADLEDKYLACRSSPFSPEAGLIGYLLDEHHEVLFTTIGHRLKQQLLTHPSFALRPHRVSQHKRKIPRGKPYPRDFRCHHLLMLIAKNDARE